MLEGQNRDSKIQAVQQNWFQCQDLEMTTERYLLSKKRNNPKESLHYASTPTLFYDENRSFSHQHQTIPVSQNNYQRKLIHQQKFNSTLYLHSSSDTSDNLSDENSGGLLTLSSQDVRKTETSIKGKHVSLTSNDV